MVQKIFPRSIMVLDSGGVLIFGYPESEKDMFVGSLLSAVMSIATTLGSEEVQKISTEKETLYVRKLDNRGTLVVGFESIHDDRYVSWVVSLLKNEFLNAIKDISEGFIDSTDIERMKKVYENFIDKLEKLYEQMEKLEKKFFAYKQLVGELAIKDLASISEGALNIKNGNLSINYRFFEEKEISMDEFLEIVSRLLNHVNNKLKALL